MSERLITHWDDANQRYLLAALALMRHALEQHNKRLRGADAPGIEREQLQQELEKAGRALPAPAALARRRAVFGLSPFECDLLLLWPGWNWTAVSGCSVRRPRDQQVQSPLILASRERSRLLLRQSPSIVTLDVQCPQIGEQRRLWQQALGALHSNLNGQIDHLAMQFNLNGSGGPTGRAVLWPATADSARSAERHRLATARSDTVLASQRIQGRSVGRPWVRGYSISAFI